MNNGIKNEESKEPSKESKKSEQINEDEVLDLVQRVNDKLKTKDGRI